MFGNCKAFSFTLFANSIVQYLLEAKWRDWFVMKFGISTCKMNIGFTFVSMEEKESARHIWDDLAKDCSMSNSVCFSPFVNWMNINLMCARAHFLILFKWNVFSYIGI